jgi:hypothetical protein
MTDTNKKNIRYDIIKLFTGQNIEEIKNKDIHPKFLIEFFDREYNGGMHILHHDALKILDLKNEGSWIVRRASIKGSENIFPFVISYKYFEIKHYCFVYIQDKGIFELDTRFYKSGDILPLEYYNLNVRNNYFENIVELISHYGSTLHYKVIKKCKKELENIY